MFRRAFCALLLALPGLAWAEVDASDVEECVSRNLPEESGVLDFSLRVRDREGGFTESAAELLWIRPGEGLSRVVLRVTQPEKTRGTSVLVVEREDDDPDLFVYLPAISKVKRVRKGRLKGSLLGTDFSYEDFERVQGLAQKTHVELTDDFEVDGRPVWVLEARPEDRRSSEYSRIVTYVDQEFCLPLRMEFVDWKQQLRKVLSSDANGVRRDGPRFLPSGFVMRDLRDRTETQVTVRSIAIDPGLAEDQFTKQALPVAARPVPAAPAP
ncbi:MAG: outer membrane lipoprotein-sorting protein [Myxococcota bacterium]|nr:outer membrane lipoprotein-sorting protein [Myxococcota bacterium]